MHVNFNTINFTPKKHQHEYTTSTQICTKPKLKEYAPIAYRDYNVSFGDRLFRSPQNFYEQEFNEKNMPKSLHRYIYEGIDSDFKRTIPPAQAMKEVFGNINYAENLDMVKKMYPNEPLFENLTSTPNRKSREGLLGMINLLKEDPEYKNKNRTLFKNGQDDLGMYILKKIYIEGKTLKEINKDFASDVSVYFKSFDIKPQDYAAFGIRFPEKPFWKSFIATREDFPYVYIPRTTSERVQAGDRSHSSSAVESAPSKKKRQPLSFVERKKLSEAMINWHANMTPEEKADWHKKLKAGMEASVFHNYFGEIVTIAQDKVNHAEKMAVFFEKVYGDPDFLQNTTSKKDRDQALTRFWKAHQQHRHDYSKAMIEVIAEFDKAYGEDGENDEFKELLLFAGMITEQNEENRKLRAEERAKTQKLLKEEQIKSEKEEIVKQEPVQQKPLTYQEKIAERIKQTNGKMYSFQLSDGTNVFIVANLKEMLDKKLDEELIYIPTAFKNRFKKFIAEHPKTNDKYLLSLFYADSVDDFTLSESNSNAKVESREAISKRMREELKDQFYSSDECRSIGAQIHKDFAEKNPALTNATKQAMIELIATMPLPDNEAIRKLAEAEFDEYVEKKLIDGNLSEKEKEVVIAANIEKTKNNITYFHSPEVAIFDATTLSDGLALFCDNKPLSNDQKKFLDDRVAYYRAPLTNKETKKIVFKITNDITSNITSFNLSKSAKDKDPGVAGLFDGCMEAIKTYPQAKKAFITMLEETYVTNENSSLRCLLDPKVDTNSKEAKMYELITEIMKNDLEFFKIAICIDKKILDKHLKTRSPEMYNALLQYRSLKGLDILDIVNAPKKTFN